MIEPAFVVHSPWLLKTPNIPKCPARAVRYMIRCTASSEVRQVVEELRANLPGGDGGKRTGRDTELAPLISRLEELVTQPDCRSDDRILGVWRNSHTSRTVTASPIQRTIVRLGGIAPKIEQLVVGNHAAIPSSDSQITTTTHTNDMLPPRHVVTRVDLRAAIGAILNVKAVVTSVAGSRINVKFDNAWFAFSQFPSWLGGKPLPTLFRLPYPVPFQLLGKKAAGWLEISYLDEDIRITRGNRGSCFVLTRLSSQDQLPITDDVRIACPARPTPPTT